MVELSAWRLAQPIAGRCRRTLFVHELRRSLFLLGVAALLVAPRSALGQTLQSREWTNDLTLGLANAAVTGSVAGIAAVIRGEDFWTAARSGAIGGAVLYSGKRVASLDGSGFRWLGRAVGSTGIAFARNGAEGLHMGERFLFPLGPVTLYVRPSHIDKVHWSVDLEDIATLTYGAVHPDFHFDWAESLKSGFAVFNATPGYLIEKTRGYTGAVSGSVVFIDRRAPGPRQRVLDHEYVHLLQNAAFDELVSDPVEGWTLGEVFGTSIPWMEHVTLSAPGWLWNLGLGLAGLRDVYRSPLEAEAAWVETH